VEQYFKAVSGRPADQHTATDIAGYLAELGRSGGLADWQFLQAVEALRLLFGEAARAPWSAEVDWAYWKDSAQSLGCTHATVARETTPTSGRPQQPAHSLGFLDRVRSNHGDVIAALIAEIRRRAYSIRTEQAYEQWVCRYIVFHADRNPRELGAGEVKGFLQHLAVHGNVAANTQNQALCALVFLYKEVLGQPFGELESFARAKRPRRLPVVLTRAEACRGACITR
jgi:hypothetical protein